MPAGVYPHQGSLVVAQHLEIGLFQPGHGGRRLFPDADASFGDYCSEQGSAALVNSFAIQQFFALRRRKAGDSVHVLRRPQGFGSAWA